MKFTDWEIQLKKHGYVVTDDLVTTKRGDVLAGKDPYGGIYINDSMIQTIVSGPKDTLPEPSVVQEETKIKTARTRKKLH